MHGKNRTDWNLGDASTIKRIDKLHLGDLNAIHNLGDFRDLDNPAFGAI